MVTEGDPASNAGTFTDVDDSDTVMITASVGTITQDAGNSGNWSWSWDTTDGPDETQTVAITADDGHGNSQSIMFNLTVNNQAPIVTPAADQTASGDPSMQSLGSFFDPGDDGDWLVQVDWGDDSPPDSFATSTSGALGRFPHLRGRRQLYGDSHGYGGKRHWGRRLRQL